MSIDARIGLLFIICGINSVSVIILSVAIMIAH